MPKSKPCACSKPAKSAKVAMAARKPAPFFSDPRPADMFGGPPVQARPLTPAPAALPLHGVAAPGLPLHLPRPAPVVPTWQGAEDAAQETTGHRVPVPCWLLKQGSRLRLLMSVPQPDGLFQVLLYNVGRQNALTFVGESYGHAGGSYGEALAAVGHYLRG